LESTAFNGTFQTNPLNTRGVIEEGGGGDRREGGGRGKERKRERERDLHFIMKKDSICKQLDSLTSISVM
jgi:hypothetical protein